mgnify:CR=1 FL=1
MSNGYCHCAFNTLYVIPHVLVMIYVYWDIFYFIYFSAPEMLALVQSDVAEKTAKG